MWDTITQRDGKKGVGEQRHLANVHFRAKTPGSGCSGLNPNPNFKSDAFCEMILLSLLLPAIFYPL